MAFVRWKTGGEADLVKCEDDRATFLSTTPAAPGTPLEGSIESGAKLRVKVARCKKAEGGFAIEGRLIDATRALREELAKVAGRSGGGGLPSSS